jgi:hypothetical protein
MPKIPLYNQGMGSAVQLAAGTLSPRADVGAFTAPGRALAGLAEQAGNIAFRFGEAEKKAEADRVYNEKLIEYANRADEFIANPGVRTIEGFNFRAREFQQGLDQDIDGLGGLTPSQRQNIKLRLNGKMQQRFSIGRTAVWTKQQAERTDITNQALDMYISDYVKTEDPEMKDILDREVKGLLDSAKEQGLNIKYDESSIVFEVRKREALLLSEDDSVTLDELKQKQKDANTLSAEFNGLTASQGVQVANIFNERINFLENGRIAELNSEAANAVLQASLTGEVDEASTLIADELRELGRPDAAEQFESDMNVGIQVHARFEPLKITTNQNVDKALRLAREELERDPTTERAAVYKKLVERVDAMRQAIAADPVAYLEAVENRELSIPERIEKQKLLGLDETQISPFSKQEFANVKAQADAAEGAEAVQIYTQFLGQYANTPYEDMALRSMMANGMTYAENIALFSTDIAASVDLVNAQKIDQKALDTAIKSLDYEKSEIYAAVQEELGPWSKSVIGGIADGYISRTGGSGRTEAVFATQEAVFKLAQVYVSRGQDPETAAKNAANIITNAYDFQETRNGGEIRVPKIYDYKSPEIVNFLDDRLDDMEYLKGTVVTDGKDEIEANQYINEISTMGYWVTNSNDTGVYLVDKLGLKVMKRVPVDGVMTVMPIEVIYGEVVDMLSYEGAGLTEQEKQKQQAYELLKITPETSTGSQGYGEE